MLSPKSLTVEQPESARAAAHTVKMRGFRIRFSNMQMSEDGPHDNRMADRKHLDRATLSTRRE